jgi:hypothetical protein
MLVSGWISLLCLLPIRTLIEADTANAGGQNMEYPSEHEYSDISFRGKHCKSAKHVARDLHWAAATGAFSR